MKIIVTHTSPDWDAIGSVWLIKKYLPGWQEATVEFVPAGERRKSSTQKISHKSVIEKDGENEIVHVDTGLGPLDHHQISDSSISAMKLVWDYIKQQIDKEGNHFSDEHLEAIIRIVKIIVEIDHFGEVYWQNPTADYHEFSLLGVLEGLKYEKPDQDYYYIEFGIISLNALVIEFENRIWAESEIKKAKHFTTRYGKGIAFETINDTVLKLAQKMGYVLVVRKDPRKGYVRIKTLPDRDNVKGIDLTLIYERLKKIDPEATWFLHISGKMLLNGTPKNPKMRPTKLGLEKIIEILERI